MLRYDSVDELIKAAEERDKNISDIVLEDQAQELGKSTDDIYHQMENNAKVMEESILDALHPHTKSASGLSGGDAYKLYMALEQGKSLGGSLMDKVLIKALAIAESNASMGRIVATPTAGSCGILPSVLLAVQEDKKIPRPRMIMSLFTAAGMGMVIAKRASISGAEGGCQAECGSAAAMAAAALVEMLGGSPRMAGHACAMALKSVLGLVCDPVAGLVEIPCIKRNATGAINAVVAAQLALAGIESLIPADEVIDAMKEVGDLLVPSLRETGEGGLAATPTARKLAKKIFEDNKENG